MLVDHNEAHLLAEPHTETDLGEVCAPVGWQFSLLLVQSGLPTNKVKVVFIAPQLGIVTKCKLRGRKKKSTLLAHNIGPFFSILAIIICNVVAFYPRITETNTFRSVYFSS